MDSKNEYPSDLARLMGITDPKRDRPRRDRYWLTRHYVAANTLVTFSIAAISPHELYARAIDAAGPAGWWVVALLASVSFVALFESFINAFISPRRCTWLRNQRHTLFMGIGIGQLCLGYVVIVYSPENAALLLRFGLDSTIATIVAFSDLFARHKRPEPA